MLVLAALAASAAAADERDAFTAAIRLAAEGEHEQAARALVELADRSPDDGLADDALLKAAQIREEQLADPLGASTLYRRVVDRYPSGRLARRAERRLQVLERGMGGDPRWADVLGQYQAILSRYGGGQRKRAVDDMKRLVEANPGFPLAGEARFWIGNSYRHDGWFDKAVDWYRRAYRDSRDPDLVWRAKKAESDALMSRGDFDDAEAILTRLDSDDPARRQMVASALDKLRRERSRSRIASSGYIVLVAFSLAMLLALWRSAGGARQTLRALLRPPTELIFLLPVAAIWIAVAFTSNTLVARAVVEIAIGGVAITWLSGAAIAAARAAGKLTRRRLIAHAIAAGLAVLAICYTAVESERLLDVINETVQFGPESH